MTPEELVNKINEELSLKCDLYDGELTKMKELISVLISLVIALIGAVIIDTTTMTVTGLSLLIIGFLGVMLGPMLIDWL